MKYKLGIKKRDEWKYIIYTNEEDLMEDVSDYLLVCDKISITRID